MIEYFFITFLVIFSIQLSYQFILFGIFSFGKEKKVVAKHNLPISIIISAKNEAENIAKNLPYFIKQSYPNFEIVLINDASTDNTLQVFKEFKKQYPNIIKIVDVAPNEQFWGSKKYALTLGIKAASFEYLLFSDADCKPVSTNWISTMANNFSEKKSIVLGYGAYSKIKNSLLNKLIRYETLLTAIQYFSYAKIGLPYMGVGRNLGYSKKTFYSVNGFVKHMQVKSGDDDLFINEAATKNNTEICTIKESFTESTPKTTFKSWIQQKRRHVSTASFYKKKHQFFLGTYYVVQLLFWMLAIFLLIANYEWQIICITIFLKYFFQYFTIGYAAKKLNERDLVLFFPFYEIFLIFIQMFIFIKNLISKPSHW